MAKRLTAVERDELASSFIKGDNVEILSQKFGCTKLSVIRNLKKSLGESRYVELVKDRKSLQKESISKLKQSTANNNNQIEDIDSQEKKSNAIKTLNSDQEFKDDFFPDSSFVEIAPLNLNIDNSIQKEFSSVSILEVDFPKVVYMIVDKKIELEIKLIKDFPQWEFLPNADLNRKAIEIYSDIKIAKRLCNKEQKVIKVPNTDVFKIASPFLLLRGITRIVSDEKLIAL